MHHSVHSLLYCRAALQAELLKLRRSYLPAMALFVPVGLVTRSFLVHNPRFDAVAWNPWNTFVNRTWGFYWAIVCFPIGVTLLAAFSLDMEDKNDAWRGLRARSVPSAWLLTAKLATLSILAFFSCLVLAEAMYVGGRLLHAKTPSMGCLLLAGLWAWFASIPLLVVHLWAAAIGGIGTTIGLGAAGVLLAGLLADTRFWIYVPWAWIVRAVMPVLNGPGSRFAMLQPDWYGTGPTMETVIPGMAVPLFLLLLLWFSRREV
jgi:hypothetical protein